MEIKVHVVELLLVEIFYVLLHFLDQDQLPSLLNREQIHPKNPLVLPDYFFHVLFENLMGELVSASELYLGCQSFLLEEEWQIPPDLDITDQILVYLNDLFGLDIVCHIASLVQPSVEVSGASFVDRPSRNQDVVNFSPLQEDLEEAHIALDDGSDPRRNVGDILQKHFVPSIMHHIVKLLVFQRPGYVVVRRKIETPFEQNVEVSNFAEDLFALVQFFYLLLFCEA